VPGPAQLAALPGEDPQQVVSPSPGMLFFAGPDMDEWADMSLVIKVEPHDLQTTLSSVPIMRYSPKLPQSSHLNS
jgi:hypothetical protein